ncbi:hypothetical protein GUITHDRAFT_141256 [Guillardia theta CCMP2712]|uniref:Uncharacterized protein n=1 Tax=Guillardia theta (strain CCMP2712) TaxID=905079 RepID=L1J2G0_GUITC|nr:hypothetical protein GUITHDRAFT_141256 [Guillardia theta CCMP2712]EKX42299.1 hypothetical protein GUITHDRAFT_141256 [Guillardia theta CCMP2712]|eukprot:XP_005829279.1 hypothetical protein GUITHDRAFT_141256 [Guillardia theta CCMP2712]
MRAEARGGRRWSSGATRRKDHWRKEEDMLENLRKKAEARLKKDEQAKETGEGHEGGTVRIENVTMKATDDGEFVPDDTIRAIAAAGGYDTVESWEAARKSEGVGRAAEKKAGSAGAGKKTSTTLVEKEKRKEERRKERKEVEAARSRGEKQPNMIENLGEWIASKFHAKNEQILAGGMEQERLQRKQV